LEDDVIVSDDRSCMFYADKLYWKGANEQELAGNYTLDLERSSCTQNKQTKGDRNATSAMYVFF
jgi:hypothetical protein